MASNSGVFAKLTNLIKNLATVDQPIRQTSQDASEFVKTALLQSFDSEQNPYGEAWKPLKHPRPGKILNLTGHLRDSFDISADPFSIDIKNTAEYSEFQDKGTNTIPARQFIPDSRGLPPTWIPRFTTIFLTNMKKHFGDK